MGVTVRQKQPGKGKPWYVFVIHQGTRKAKCIGDKKAAEAVASALRERLSKGDFNIDTEEQTMPSFKKYAEGWLVNYSQSFCKHSTDAGYISIIKSHLVPFFGDVPLDQIQRRNVKELIGSKLSEGLSPGTVRNIRLCLSSILSSAIDDELISANPATQLGKKIRKFLQANSGEKNINFLTREEVSLFLRTTLEHVPRLYPVFLCAVRTGMRAGELIGLKPGDVDFNGMFIEIRRGIVRGRITTPKNGKSRRVDMSQQLAATLTSHLVDIKRETLRKGWREPPEWLFFTEEGHHLDVDNLRKRYFYKVLEKAGLRRIRFHDLRHSFASLLIAQGESLAYVRDQLGHSSIQITVDTYGHLVPGSNRQAVDRLDDMQPMATQAQPERHDVQKKVLSLSPST